MAQFLALFLIMVHTFVILAMANETVDSLDQPKMAPISSPSIRKLGKHRYQLVKFTAEAPHFSPSQSPRAKDDHLHFDKEVSPMGHQDPESGLIMQEIHPNKHHHESVDKSVAGGGVILGGLATTFLVAIFRYIRATRRNNARPQPSSP